MEILYIISKFDNKIEFIDYTFILDSQFNKIIVLNILNNIATYKILDETIL